jgi:hypothetical protein
MIRFLLRSPLLWIGMLVAAYLSWLWLKSMAKPIGFSYSRGGQMIQVAAGYECYVMIWRSEPGLDQGFVNGGPEMGLVLTLASLTRRPVGGSGHWAPGYSHLMVTWSFRVLLGGYLALWYGVLGWRAWRYHRRSNGVQVAAAQAAPGD